MTPDQYRREGAEAMPAKERLMNEIVWTVARFPDGSWTYGGPPDSADYNLCDVWTIAAPSPSIAIRRAQGRYRRMVAARAEAPPHT